MIILVKVKAMHTEKVEGMVITDFEKITKPVIPEDNLKTHKDSVLLISMVKFHTV